MISTVLKSSFVKHASYSQKTNRLYLTIGKTTYVYNSVPMGVFNDIVSSDSVGKYFNRFIRGHYNFFKGN